jgi:hypothetical protein
MTTQETRIKVSLATGERFLVSNVGSDCWVFGPLTPSDLADIRHEVDHGSMVNICGVTPVDPEEYSREAGWETEVRFPDLTWTC